MRRRRAEDADSLELLLDTVCNMFGGVIFIAILLALLAGKPGEALAADRAQEAERLRAEVERVEATVGALLGMGMGDSELDGQVSKVIADRAAAEVRLRRALDQRTKLEESGKTVEDRLAMAAKRRSELSAIIADLESRIEDEKRRHITAARLPVAKVTEKIPIHLVVRGSHAFEVYRNDGRGGYLDQPLDVETTREGAGGSIHRVRLKDDGGFPVDDRIRSRERWRAILGRMSADRHFLYIMVYPSGYASFRALRDAALRDGFEYDLILFPENKPIVLSPGSDFRTQ